MKTITKRIILIYSYLFFSLLFYDFSFAFSDPEREIIVYISPEFIDFPDSTDNGFLLSSSGISSSNLYNLLDTSGIVNISRTFPSYTKADTILTDSFGREFNISLFSRVYTILLSSSDSIEVLIDRLYQLYDEVIFAERNIVSVTTGSDPEFDKQWYLRNTGQGSGTKGEDIKIESVWRIATGGPITIGLIDAGVQLDHPDLASRVSGDSYFWDVNGNPAENITTNHGTQMAGIIGAITNNAYNIKGINWISPINSYRVYKNGVSMSDVTFTNQIEASARNDGIMNLSFESPTWYHLVRFAIKYATDIKRRIVVSITGNSNTNVPKYPGSFNQVLTVGAVSNNGERESYSNYGNAIDLVAPGGISGNVQSIDRIISTSIGGGTKFGNGTSQAGAMVTGLISVLLNYRNLEKSDMEGLVKASCDNIGAPGWDEFTGYGKLNGDRAIQYLRAPMF